MLEEKVVLVTGASRGIGKAIAEAMLNAGATVWFAGRNQESLHELCSSLGEQFDGQALPIAFDVGDPVAIRQAFSQIQKSSKRLDVLVNNAGLLKASMIEMASVDLMDQTYKTNLRSVLVTCQYASRLMARRGGGSIINVTSIMGRFGYAGQAVYAASKAGVIGVTLSLAKELAGRNIRVNAIAPGAIDTDLISDLTDDKKAETVAAIGMGRIGKPSDVWPLALFLASDASAYITGQVIGVDGGMVV